MVLYEVKLIDPDKKTVYYRSLKAKAELPDQETLKKYPHSILVIDTKSSQVQPLETKKAS